MSDSLLRQTTPPRTAPAPRASRAEAAPAAAPETNSTASAERSFWQSWRWWLPVSALTLFLALFFVDPFAGDWDALDYTVLALRGEPSSMLFGRMLFLFGNHLAFRAAHALFGLQPEHAYLLFKYMVVAQSPLAAAVFWALVRELTSSVRTATIAALLLTLSPFFIVYSGQAMTEVPSLLWLSAALLVHVRGLKRQSAWQVLIGAAFLGLGTNVRETAALYGLWLVAGPLVYGWTFSRRNLLLTAAACLLFFVCALGLWGSYYYFDLGGYRGAWYGWVESMRMEEAVHPVSIKNFVPLFFFFFIAAPLSLVALPAAVYSEWRAARGWRSPLLALALIGFVANMSLISHYSTVINGRYLLTGLVGVIPLAASFFVRYETRQREGSERRGFRVALAGVVGTALLIGGTFYPMAWPTIAGHGLTKEYRARLALLPDDAVVIAGGQTVSVTFYKGVGLGRWDAIGTGGGWPYGRLPETINYYLDAGRRVFVDVDPRLWFTDSWRAQETRELADAAKQFRFRRVSDTIYEIRPPDDDTARDTPDIERLLHKQPSKLNKLSLK
ncbi:MAG: glycosyltransferase family 39 protein [Pyrinomonadaceae bacterium]